MTTLRITHKDSSRSFTTPSEDKQEVLNYLQDLIIQLGLQNAEYSVTALTSSNVDLLGTYAAEVQALVAKTVGKRKKYTLSKALALMTFSWPKSWDMDNNIEREYAFRQQHYLLRVC
jgi:hypothetical protein